MVEILLGPSVLGLVTAVFFALSILCIRKGLDGSDAATGTLISIAASTALFWVTAPLYMEAGSWFSPALLVFGAVGLFRPVISTYLSNAATKQVGPTIAATVGSVGPFFAVAGGVLLLGEPLGPATVLGTLGIMSGVMVLSSRGRAPRTWAKVALLLPLGSAVLRAAAHVMVKYGLEMLPEPFMAGLVSYSVSLVLALLTTAAGNRQGPARASRGALRWFVSAGICNALAIMALNVALLKGMVVFVGPLTATFPLFTLLFSVVFFRQERVTGRTLAGVVLITAGVIAILVLR
jgi:drug/metabolite transporter (DMT)-like permease